MSIQKLPSGTIKLIGSTQVITSVSSAVKELVENSIDAGATTIDIRLDNYGLDRIEVKDDGCGIPKSEVQFSCLKSYTSKISNFDDLEKLSSYGFRGEALNALCTLGQVTVTTIAADEDIAFCHVMNCDGSIKQSKPSHVTKGTIVTVEGLMRRVPVRRQRAAAGGKKAEELRKTESVVKCLAAVHPNLRVTIAHDKCILWVKSKCRTLLENIAQVVPPTVARQLQHVPFKDEKDRFDIVLPKKDCNVPTMCCSSLNEATHLYINRRPITDRNMEKEVQSELYQYFGHFIPSGKYPYIFVLIHLPPEAVDVNLEPNKTKVILTDGDQLLIKLKRVICDYYCNGRLLAEDNVEDSSTSKRKCDVPSELEPCKKVKVNNNEFNTVNSDQNIEGNEADKILDVHGNDVSEMFRDLMEGVDISFDDVVTSTQTDDANIRDEGFESDDVIEKKCQSSEQDQNTSDFFADPIDSSSEDTAKEKSTSCKEDPVNVVESNQQENCKTSGESVQNSDECLEENIEFGRKEATPPSSLDLSDDEIRVMSAEMNAIIDDNRHLINQNGLQDDLDDITLSQWSRGHISAARLGSAQGTTVASGAKLVAGTNCESFSTNERTVECPEPDSKRDSLRDDATEPVTNNVESPAHSFGSSKTTIQEIHRRTDETIESNLENKNLPSSTNQDNPVSDNESIVSSNRKPEAPEPNVDSTSSSELESPRLGVKCDANGSKPRSIESQMGMPHMAGFKKFAKEAKARMLQASPGMSFVRVASKLVSEWKLLGAEEKQRFEELAKVDKAKPATPVAKSDPGKPIIVRKNCYEKICYLDVSVDYIKANASKWGSCNMNDNSLFGQISEDVHLFYDVTDVDEGKVEINAFSSRRLAEVLLLHRNLASMEVPSRILAEPIAFKQRDVDKRAWEYLTELQRIADPRDGSTIVSDESLTKNGFRIELSQDYEGDMEFHLTNVAAQINHVGLDDLQELLVALRLGQEVTRSRPLKIASFIRSESVRSIDRSSIEPLDCNNISSSLNYYCKHVRAVLPKCPHHRLVVKTLHLFNIS